MNLIDSHAHLSKATYQEKVPEVIARAGAAGVERIITVGTDLADGAEAIGLCRQFSNLACAVGFHPHNAGKVEDAGDWGKLEELLQVPEVVAVGEIGLDYHYDFSDPARQREVFERQLRIAREHNKPVVIHCREAFEDCLRILDQVGSGVRILFHCFSGNWSDAQAVLARGGYISLSGIITFKKSEALQEVARNCPADRLLIETDSPYLSPEPMRKIQPNEPALLVHTASKLTALRGVPLAQIAQLTSANTRGVFRLTN